MEWEPIENMDIDESDYEEENMLLLNNQEWESIENMDIDEYDYEEEENMLLLNNQVDDHVQWEEDYELYINENFEDERLENISRLIENYRSEGNNNNWNYWDEVNFEYKKEAIKLIIYQIRTNISPPINELRNQECYYNYLLFLANVLRNL